MSSVLKRHIGIKQKDYEKHVTLYQTAISRQESSEYKDRPYCVRCHEIQTTFQFTATTGCTFPEILWVDNSIPAVGSIPNVYTNTMTLNVYISSMWIGKDQTNYLPSLQFL